MARSRCPHGVETSNEPITCASWVVVEVPRQGRPTPVRHGGNRGLEVLIAKPLDPEELEERAQRCTDRLHRSGRKPASARRPRLIAWLERTLEQDLRLTVNRAKTRVVRLREPKASLDVLGFTLRYDQDRCGRGRRYLNIVPSTRAQARVREKLRNLTGAHATRALLDTIAANNPLRRGWASYFRYGYPRAAFRALNYYVQVRFRCLQRNRSQRRSRPFRAGTSLYAGLQYAGLLQL